MSDPIRLTRAQVREIDRISIDQYHIPGIVLMENASRCVADVAGTMLGGVPGRKILILCGGGNNGGDGLAAARHLHNRGADVSIALTLDPGRYKGDALINWRIIRKMGIPAASADASAIASISVDLLIDAIFGTGLTEPPRAPFPDLVAAIGQSRVPVLAVDLPSGLDCDTGVRLGDCVRATKTVTFVAEKAGFASPQAFEFTGEIVVGDIGSPIELIDRVIADIPPKD